MTVTATSVSAEELKALDPKRFQREYYKWATHAADYNWYEDAYEYFLDKWAAQGLTVDPKSICFSGFYSQGDALGFTGNMDASVFMQSLGYHETHYALWLDVQNYGAHIYTRRSPGWSNRINGAELDYYVGNTNPTGVFQDLPTDVWDDLVAKDYDEVVTDIEEAATEFFQKCADELFKALQDEYDYLTSEECFIENCEINDIRFEIETEDFDEGDPEHEVQN
jgi:hypothetical protein